MKNLDSITDTLDRVRPFPQVVVKVLHMLEDPDIPASKIVEVIQYDPVITMRLLQVCNSAMFAVRRKVESLQQAMMLLGNQAMVRLLIAFGALETLKDPLPGYGLERGELLEHAIACATLSQILLKDIKRPEDHCTFTGAVLHDVGKIVLNEFAGSEYKEISRMVEERGTSGLEAERQVLGVDHAELGAELARRWNLPESITVIIGRHHDQVDPSRDPLALCLVHLANVLCVQLGIGTGVRGLASKPSTAVIDGLGWTPRRLDGCLSAFWCELERVRNLLSLSPSRRG